MDLRTICGSRSSTAPNAYLQDSTALPGDGFRACPVIPNYSVPPSEPYYTRGPAVIPCAPLDSSLFRYMRQPDCCAPWRDRTPLASWRGLARGRRNAPAPGPDCCAPSPDAAGDPVW